LTNSPRTLFLSIAATACGFILALVGAIGQASNAASPAVEVAMTPGTVAQVVRDVSHVDPITYEVALDAAASHPRYDDADRDDGTPLLFTVAPDGLIIVGRGAKRIDYEAATGFRSAKSSSQEESHDQVSR
jgi:hypothetical protein